ncbi:RNB domain-containing ribonuclease [Krasilnikoviella flava]|uniref:RNB domain-containing protein n=1 Tax=Krasilnikoviella flava TaxID=526729 RepID=A0A1T5LI07_9MICO|nr:RNB domain-containing ribonuclease [Krasilnikoviella flava]SKC75494.1 RNB domain-containing protein [Krasilnikoviella flava]
MPTRQLHLAQAGPAEVADALAALRAEVRLPAMFPVEVREEAEKSAADGGHGAVEGAQVRQDRRDVELVTIDPPGSMDLDQAVHVASSGRGYIVRYAIADVAEFVRPGGGLDAETHRRGTTVYGPDVRTPLHPAVLSEGAASLLPDEDRPAVLWTIGLDADGEITSSSVTRATVRSRDRLTYGEVQAQLDAGAASDSLSLLADVGRLRQARERDRGGVSLEVPEQEIVPQADGSFSLELRRTLPVEGWNAQISLLTGIAAAAMMREAGVGLLRTLPPADDRDVARLRRTAVALGIDWPDDLSYAQLVPTLESRRPAHAAFLAEATTLFRGAGYLAFGVPGPDDGAPVALPDDARHAAIGAEYAHVTAPLRRLADRYATEVCLAHAAGKEAPAWVTDALPGLPGTMAAASSTAGAFERGCVDVVEAALLVGREGETFDGVVVDVRDGDKDGVRRGEVMLTAPAVRARLEGADLPLGERVRPTLAEASVADRRVLFTLR